MRIHPTTINDCIWLEPKPYLDDRGIFCELFKQSYLGSFYPTQSNYSFSKNGVLRGIHRTPYAKLVTCVQGEVYDVCVDLRPESNTYKKYFGIVLQENTLNSLYIPPYCGHGFLALKDSILIYQQDGEYNKNLDESYCYQSFGIEWPSDPSIISEKDKNSCLQTMLSAPIS